MAYRYYRNCLSVREQKTYDRILDGLLNMEYPVKLTSDCNMQEVSFIWKLVKSDNPDLFYVGPAVSFSSNNQAVSVEPDYTIDASEISRRWRTIESHLAAYKSTLPSSPSDYDKVERAYEYIIQLCEYGFSQDDQNMCSVFCDAVSCCAGYSSALQYLLGEVGVPCLYASGSVNGKKKQGNHAWNAACINGIWSWVDVTWGDPVRDGKDPEEVCYDYLCVTDRDLGVTHHPDPILATMLPKCTDNSNDWYVRNHMMFSTYDEHAIEQAVQGDVLSREIGFGKDMKGECHIKFTRIADAKTAYSELFQTGRLTQMLEPVYNAYGYYPGVISFSINDEIGTVTARYPILKRGN